MYRGVIYVASLSISLFAFLLSLTGCAGGAGGGAHHQEAMEESQDGQARSNGIVWFDLEVGRMKALSENRPMVVDFFTSLTGACERCSLLDQFVYSDPRIIKKMNEEFVPIRINLGRELTADERALGERFDFKNDCLLVFLDPQGDPIVDETRGELCYADYIDPERFLENLEITKRRSAMQ